MTMPTQSVCAFYQFGHCKFGSFCNKKHMNQTCMNYPCTIENCPKRHPRPCKYYVTTGYCKFSDLCSYLHPKNDSRNEIEKEVSKLRKEVEALKAEIQAMRHLLLESTIKCHQELVKSPTKALPYLASMSSILVVSNPSSCPPDNSDSWDFTIPQYDGLNSSIGRETSNVNRIYANVTLVKISKPRSC